MLFVINQPTPPPPGNTTILVDSSYTGYNSAVLDGEIINAYGGTATTWASAETSSPHWVELQFLDNKTIGNVTLWWAWNAGQSSFMTSQQVDVQYWNGAWQTLGTIGGNNVPYTELLFSQVYTDRIRLYQPANLGPSSYNIIMWMTEIDYNIGGAVCCGSYDSNCQNGIETGELQSAIQDWFDDNIRISQLLQTIRYWKNAC